MVDSQIYIGTPNGIVLCVDSCSGHVFKGSFYHLYSKEPIVFDNQDQLIFGMEEFFDSILFPHPANNVRSFADTKKKRENKNCDVSSLESRQLRMNNIIKKREKVMDDQELLGKHGDLGSFIVRVQHRQNSSMQGRVTWVEKNKTVFFRSAWEMIRLIDSALETDEDEKDEKKDLPSWD